ncbi:hypothetical protein [Mucilaginibacter sp.]|uniref:hypothetical protein n=1 Tax=Mucilaginibacter sp. TaxID=1882438 RepID=UPI00262691CF|nr:hypothetical protein [Mucilaginibacter sp.]MDB4922909.1 hypothetical protein [Mucilaginibacter sp.]
MYRGFQLNLDPKKFSDYLANGEQIHEVLLDGFKEVLDQYAVSDTVLDGSKMQADWFPQAHGDIFISHAHADQKLAMGLAGWLYEKFEIIAFIDSCIWGHADVLLRNIDDVHCKDPKTGNYNYQRRNRSTAHVHIMVNNALSKMIDHMECLFFLDTPKSTVRELVEKKTQSPWIYSELSISRIIRKRIPERAQITELFKAFSGGGALNESQREEVQIQYMLELDHLVKLNTTDLEFWARAFQTKKKLIHVKEGHPLDTLYEIKPLKKPR